MPNNFTINFFRNEEWLGGESKNGPSEQDPSGEATPSTDNDEGFANYYDEVVDNFDDMGLKEELLRGIYAYGFEKPSAIQQRAIMPCIKGHDVTAQAQSGTGKTATFSISILQQIDTSINECQALILAPTRELAQQVKDCLYDYHNYYSLTKLQLISQILFKKFVLLYFIKKII